VRYTTAEPSAAAFLWNFSANRARMIGPALNSNNAFKAAVKVRSNQHQARKLTKASRKLDGASHAFPDAEEVTDSGPPAEVVAWIGGADGGLVRGPWGSAVRPPNGP